MHVAVNLGAGHHRFEVSALVFADCDATVETVNAILVGGIDAKVRVVKWSWDNAALVTDRFPTRSTIV